MIYLPTTLLSLLAFFFWYKYYSTKDLLSISERQLRSYEELVNAKNDLIKTNQEIVDELTSKDFEIPSNICDGDSLYGVDLTIFRHIGTTQKSSFLMGWKAYQDYIKNGL